MSSFQSSSIMGILNLSPESFSDGGLYSDLLDAKNHFELLVKEGASYIDLGGMASGPGTGMIPLEEEISRLSPFLDEIDSPDIILSLDTFRAPVAEICIEKGVRIINDISALRYDDNMAALIARKGLEVVLMYSKESADHPMVSSTLAPKGELLDMITSFLESRIDYALASGIVQGKIILDPGMGAFLGESPESSWMVLKILPELMKRFTGFRFLVGVSRKSFLGAPLADRDIHSKVIELYLADIGVSIIRTHQVGTLERMLRTKRILNEKVL